MAGAARPPEERGETAGAQDEAAASWVVVTQRPREQGRTNWPPFVRRVRP